MSNVEITICPPGKRSRNIVQRVRDLDGGPPVSTATALQWPQKPSIVPPARNDRRSAQERVEAAQRADALSVALSQPHRSGSDDAALECPLGRFCLASWPARISDNGEDLNLYHRRDMFNAGMRYAEVVHQHRVLIGLGTGAKTDSEGGSLELTDAEMIANREAARIKRDDADAALRTIFKGAVSAMMRLCVDEMPLAPTQEDLARHCLWALAVHFGIVKLGRFGSAS